MGVFHYRFFGLHIDSEVDLGGASHERGATPDVRIRLGSVPGLHASSTAREDHIRVRDTGAFLIRDGEEIVADLKPGVAPELVRVLLNGRLMAYLLRQRGWFPLHGSAVQVGSGAVIFIASAGTGKSTMAAALCSRGYTVLSDDVSPVQMVSGAYVLQPGRPRLRLCEDSALQFSTLAPAWTLAVDKHELQVSGPESPGCVPVQRIYVLENGEDLRVEEVPPLDAMRAIGKECFVRLHCASSEVLVSHLRSSSALVNAGLVRRLSRPRGFGQLDAVVRAIEADLGLG